VGVLLIDGQRDYLAILAEILISLEHLFTSNLRGKPYHIDDVLLHYADLVELLCVDVGWLWELLLAFLVQLLGMMRDVEHLLLRATRVHVITNVGILRVELLWHVDPS
jgi:hypothetical protein